MADWKLLHDVRFLAYAYILMLFVIFILPFYSLDDYTILRNTTSQLGAQNTPNSWIMNFTFVILGITSIYAGWRFLGKYWFQKIVLLVFGTALIMTAIFQHAPIDPSLYYSVKEDNMHSLFANITGFSFSILAVSIGFVAKERKHKILAFLVTLLAPLLSLMMFYEYTEGWKGIWQRFIFIGMFGWMIYTFYNYELKT